MKKNGIPPAEDVPAGVGPTLITGGAGFIGTNLADRLLSMRRRVVLLDNLSRPGVEQNVKWLRARHPELLEVRIGDVRNAQVVAEAVRGASHVFHFAAQVAVTTSLTDPATDFDVNGRGTLNVLEAVRRHAPDASLVFTSTNKVYGRMDGVELAPRKLRYEPVDLDEATHGFDEQCPLSFHSPYGCSKGAADQYVIDYAHTFGLRSCVFRMSCIYGPHQFGTEDQGWVAHFAIRAMEGQPITLYGDGRQVRDILFADDLVRAFLLAESRIGDLAGQAFNMGGGPENTTSLLELTNLISEIHGEALELQFSGWRTADQRYYVSDTRRFSAATGWKPRVSVRSGVTQLYGWLAENRFSRDRTLSAASPAPEDLEAFPASALSGS
ncbi:CDP-paratose 2-epimerase [Opitutaceae bacterium EW11]|nr:CDP-paratose 2-epimerase [Opitutaceae bacterium EW11]